MKLKYLILLAIATSCSATIKNFDKYEKQFLSKTEFMPSKESLENKPPKIVVFALDENENLVEHIIKLVEEQADKSSL